MKFDCAVVGGGIIGLATAMTLLERRPGIRVVVLEKEPELARHQTGRNSGVIHSGIYYKPGSLKARFAREGNRRLREFCRLHDIPHEVCGKLIVATEPREVPLLEALYRRGLDNQLEAQALSPEQVRDIEPNVRCLKAIRVPSTGIVDFRAVALKFSERIEQQGGLIR